MKAKPNGRKRGRKSTKSRRRNSVKTTRARVAAPRSTAAKRNPATRAKQNRKRGRKRGRRNPFKSSLRNPQGVFSFLVAAAAAGVGNEVFNALAAKLMPGSLGTMARAGAKLGAAYFLRNNKTLNKFTGGNAGAISLVIAALAAADLARPYISGPLAQVTNFIPSLGAPQQQGAGQLVDYYPTGVPAGLGQLSYIPGNF